MSDVLMQAVVLAYALTGGVFLAFSDFLMRSLSKTGAAGAEAMQVINREVFRWVFMALLLGLVPVSAGLVVLTALGWLALPAGLGGAVYLVGCFGVTVVCNVPMNERLAGMAPAQAETLAYWRGTYLPRWTFWNSVRTAACVAAAWFMMRAG